MLKHVLLRKRYFEEYGLSRVEDMRFYMRFDEDYNGPMRSLDRDDPILEVPDVTLVSRFMSNFVQNEEWDVVGVKLVIDEPSIHAVFLG